VRFSLILAVLTTSTALFGAASGTGDTFHWSGKLPAGKFIEIRGINGSIHAEPSLGSDVDVIAYKGGQELDSSGVEFQVVEHDGGVTVCAVYRSLDGRSDGCAPGPGASNNSDVEVDFTVHVPKGVRFVGRTVNGLVEARSLDADTEGHTVNGNVCLSTAGAATGDTVNGSIEASVGSFQSPLNFSTVNGGITLVMPARTGARVHANTVNGRIQTDFPLAVRGRYVSMRADGAIGHGGPELKLATVNGSIKLKRRVTRF
jgi:hypothetical protein